MSKVALIGGSGIYLPNMLDNIIESEMLTPFGTVMYSKGTIDNKEVIFMTRHGKKHSVPPHKINYRANIYALKKLGVKYIIASAAVGSLNKKMRVGDFVIPDQLLDFTKSRINSFYNGEDNKVVHVDVTDPYCKNLIEILASSAKKSNINPIVGATYVCTEGPRFETAAEIKMYEKLGGDIVGMTASPELVLAREAEMCYATFALVTNMAAGISKTQLSHQEVYDEMKVANDKIVLYLTNVLKHLVIYDDDCECLHALKEFGGFNL